MIKEPAGITVGWEVWAVAKRLLKKTKDSKVIITVLQIVDFIEFI